MENYERIETIGEGTYGVVLKCRSKINGRVVAIKKFKESDDDESVRKTALREVRILKQLKHDNIVSLIEVFRRKGTLYLVFEFVDRTILQEVEDHHPEGLEPEQLRRVMWQLVRAVGFCHAHNVIHRDIKPENLLISKHGALKLCDFGFARAMSGPGANYTEYVSTRWYRAPELLIGDRSYGKPVDMWAIGCMMAELANGLPLFPGETDVDQLHHIMRTFGKLTPRMEDLVRRNPLFAGTKLPHVTDLDSLDKKLTGLHPMALDVIRRCLAYEPLQRASCADLLRHEYFKGLEHSYAPELQRALQQDREEQRPMQRGRSRRRGSNTHHKHATSFQPPSQGPSGQETAEEAPAEELTAAFLDPAARSPGAFAMHDESAPEVDDEASGALGVGTMSSPAQPVGELFAHVPAGSGVSDGRPRVHAREVQQMPSQGGASPGGAFSTLQAIEDDASAPGMGRGSIPADIPEEVEEEDEAGRTSASGTARLVPSRVGSTNSASSGTMFQSTAPPNITGKPHHHHHHHHQHHHHAGAAPAQHSRSQSQADSLEAQRVTSNMPSMRGSYGRAGLGSHKHGGMMGSSYQGVKLL